MPSTYSSNLKIELMATGENANTWGNITNTNLGTTLEQAIVGLGNPVFASDANLTITLTNTNAAQAARALVLNATSSVSLTATRELVVPTFQKQYIVQNNTTGGQSITVKTSAGTGVTVPNGRKAHLYVDGTNVIQMFDFVDINGGTIDGTVIGGATAAAGTFTTVNATTVNATTLDLTNLETTNIKAKDGTSAATIADSTGVVSFVANPVLSGGTANGVLYLNGSKVATSGSALTFDGTNLATTGNVTLGDASTDTVTVNGTMGVGGAVASASFAVNVRSTALTSTTQVGVVSAPVGTSAATANVIGFYAFLGTAATAFTTSLVAGLRVDDAIKGAGSTITNQSAVYINDQTQGTNNYGITSLVSAGANKWNIYASGTANNYFSGFAKFGSASAPSTPLDVDNIGSGANTLTRGMWIRTVDLGASTGNAGVYLSAPYASGTTNEAFFRVKRGAGSVYNGAEIAFNGQFRFLGSLTEDTSERMRIDASGNVSIGTASPTSTLSVNGTANVTGNVTLGDASTDTVTVNGYMAVGGAVSSTVGAYIRNNALTGVNQYGIRVGVAGTSAGTNSVRGMYVAVETAAAAYTTNTVVGVQVDNIIKGAGSTVTNAYGIFLGDQTQGTNNYGLVSAVSAGANKWNIYATGNADNYFNGNIGLGVTPSAWSVIRAIQIGGAYGQSFYADNGATQVGLASNAYYSSTGWKYFDANVASRYFQDTGAHYWSSAPSGTADAALTFTQLMTLSREGNLGINTAPNASWGPNFRAIEMSAASSSNIVARVNAMSVGTNYYIDSGSNFVYSYTTQNATRYTQTFAGQHQWFTAPAGTAGNAISFTQMMTLDADGDLGIGTTAPAARLESSVSSAGATAEVLRLSNPGAGVNTQAQINFFTTATSYGTISGGYGASAPQMTFNLPSATAGNYVWQISTAERMRLDASGNLGIGTTSLGARLQVASSAYAAHFGEGTGNAGIDFRNRLSALPTTGTVATIAWLESTSGFTAGSLLIGARPATGQVVLSSSGAADVLLNTSGNLGLGVTPSGWTVGRTIQVHAVNGGFLHGATLQGIIGINAYFDGSWKYAGTGIASRYEQQTAGHLWYTAPSGTAGNAITFTQAMTLDTNNRLLVGTTTNTNSSTVVSGGTISETVSSTQYLVASQYDIGTAPNEIPINGYLGALAYEDSEFYAPAVGSGITAGTGTICKTSFSVQGGMKLMSVVIDLTGLNSGGTAGDIIGVNGTANPCYIALIPSTYTVLGGRMTCLETPAGGDTDIDLYSAVEGTGVEDQAITALTETQIINAGAQTRGTVTYFSADPAENTYFYLVGQGTANATYTAGRFLIEVFGA